MSMLFRQEIYAHKANSYVGSQGCFLTGAVVWELGVDPWLKLQIPQRDRQETLSRQWHGAEGVCGTNIVRFEMLTKKAQ